MEWISGQLAMTRHLWLVLFFSLCFPAAAAGLEGPEYRLGDMVEEDVVTPVPLIVLSPEETQERRRSSAQRVPAIYRFDANAVDEVEGNMRAAFAKARGHFLVALEGVFKERQVEATALADPRFDKVLANFRRKEPIFPLATNLLECWATGRPDASIEAEWIVKLRLTMRQYLRSTVTPVAAQSSAWQAILVFTGTNGPLTATTIKTDGIEVARTNMIKMAQARLDFQEQFIPAEAEVAKYLTRFLRMNCLFDETATEDARAKKVENIYATAHYQPGETILTKGQRIDARGLAVWEELQLKTAAEKVRAEAAVERARAQALLSRLAGQAATAQVGIQNVTKTNYWLWISLSGTLLLAVLALALASRRRPAASSRLPVHLGGEPATALGGDTLVLGPHTAITNSWPEQLTAQGSAEPANVALRAGLLAELARWMMNKFVVVLARDRRVLLAQQRAAIDEISALDRRLAELQTPLKDRLSAYENRISDLEAELQVKGTENAELIKTKIALTRQQLEVERSKGVFN